MNGPGCEPVFIISVAARLLEMHPQTLRKYEREGLIAPSRTSGNLRLYSDEDLVRLRQVKHLVGELGLNLAGVQLVLEVTHRLQALQDHVQADGTGQSAVDREQIARDVDGLMRLLGVRQNGPSRQRQG